MSLFLLCNIHLWIQILAFSIALNSYNAPIVWNTAPEELLAPASQITAYDSTAALAFIVIRYSIKSNSSYIKLNICVWTTGTEYFDIHSYNVSSRETYDIDGVTCVVSKDPHFTTFNGARHDTQGVPVVGGRGQEQFYYMCPCVGSDFNDMPFTISGRHYRWGYITIQLYDSDNNEYLVFLSSDINAYTNKFINTLYDDNINNVQTLSIGDNRIGDNQIGDTGRFNINYSKTGNNISVILTINGHCNIQLTMSPQWSEQINAIIDGVSDDVCIGADDDTNNIDCSQVANDINEQCNVCDAHIDACDNTGTVEEGCIIDDWSDGGIQTTTDSIEDLCIIEELICDSLTELINAECSVCQQEGNDICNLPVPEGCTIGEWSEYNMCSGGTQT